MPHVGIQGLATGDHQHHDGQNEDALKAVTGEEGDGVIRIHRLDDAGLPQNAGHPERGDAGEPDEGERPEDGPDAGGAPLLNPKQREQNHQGERHNQRLECGRRDAEALDRA